MTAPNLRDAAIDGRPCNWYLRWFNRAVIPTDAHLAVYLLDGLSRCAQLAVLVVADRRRRAYKRSKANNSCNCGGLQHRLLGRARCPGCADVVLLMAGSTSSENDGFRPRRWTFTMTVLVLSADSDDAGLEWLALSPLVLNHEIWGVGGGGEEA
ncbi:hypothetical protein T440DRAFT_78450 [Plenodomus tracheiphilus IPT5]|uniref:Uncharacterized protein n=1 Tax=Plenodomus tracheiphilus IPT5 TaxID=1408161 RepID=A0A6A7B725_9PLEO|nr:hypothetical protein T440DRAFT_78450 [Plenodomus tracheiphilus IPT5]